jgi:hypothetical protein
MLLGLDKMVTFYQNPLPSSIWSDQGELLDANLPFLNMQGWSLSKGRRYQLRDMVEGRGDSRLMALFQSLKSQFLDLSMAKSAILEHFRLKSVRQERPHQSTELACRL